MLGLGLGIGAVQTLPLARYSLGGKAPAVVADPVAGVYGLGGRSVGFDGLFTFSRLSAAWKLNALGHWVKVLAGEPRIGHHIWKGGKLVPAGIAVCSKVRTQLLPYASSPATNWGSPEATKSETEDGFTILTSNGAASYPRIEKLANVTTPGTYTVQTEAREGSSGEIFLRVTGVDIGLQPDTSSVYKFDFSDQSFVKVGGATATQTYVEEIEPGVFRIAFSFPATSVAWVNIYPAWGDDTPGLSAEFRHPMLSEGGVPGNFIPNDTSAQVSTASESLQIDPVKLAKAVGEFGPELVSNSDGSSGTSGWYGRSDSAISVENGRLRSTIGADLTQNVAIIQEIPNLTIGQRYVLRCAAYRSAGILDALFRVSNSSALGSGGPVQIDAADGDIVEIVFTATATLHFFGVVGVTQTPGNHVEIESPTLREVTMPEALTLVMKGTMTYEDDNGPVPVRPFTWELDAGNRMATALGIEGAETGRMWFNTTSEGVSTSVSSSINTYSPGVDVPFSLALVLTATELEGFCNGVSTGKTIHGGMANLLSAPLQLFPVGTATIEHFSIYVGNPGSAALQEATA